MKGRFVLEQRKARGFNAGFQKKPLGHKPLRKMSRPAAIDKRPGGILMCWETEKLWDFIKSFKSLQWMYQNTADGLLLHFCDMIFHLPKKKDVSLTKYSFIFRGIFCWADLTCRVYSWVKKSNINATDPPSTTNSKFFGGDFSPYFNKKTNLN